jgi:TonB family protein
MIDPSFSNLVVYNAQVLAVVLVAAIAARCFRLPGAATRLAYWRAAILGALVPPIVAPAAPAVVVTATSPSIVSRAADAAFAGSAAATTGPSALTLGLWLIGVGIALRALWIGLGLARLRYLNAHGTIVDLDEGIDALRVGLAAHAVIRSHPAVRQPVTFGIRRPVVLVPHEFRSMTIATQRAVVSHELIHVRRRDWLWVIAEEAVRTVFWFHPAVRWALNEIQLGREELVDERAVALTGAKREYMNALLMFSNRLAITSATLFARRNQLAVRIRRIAEEVPVSSIRIAASGVALMIVLTLSIGAIVSTVPLTAAPQLATRPILDTFLGPDGIRIQIAGTSARRASRSLRPEYPTESRRLGVGATVLLDLSVDAAGHVEIIGEPRWQLSISDQNAIADLESFWAGKPWLAFVEAAEAAVRQWTLEPAAGEARLALTITFAGGPNDTVLIPPPPPPPPPQFRPDSQPGAIGPVVGSNRPGTVSPAAPPPPPPPPNELPRVRRAIGAALQISSAQPEYPPAARAARVQGTVVLDARIDREGSVADVRVLRSIPLLDTAAIDAARKWKSESILLNGEPVDGVVTVTVTFTLSPPD